MEKYCMMCEYRACLPDHAKRNVRLISHPGYGYHDGRRVYGREKLQRLAIARRTS